MKEIEEHYFDQDVKDIILNWSNIEDPGEGVRALIGGHSGWYRYENGKKALIPAEEDHYDDVIQRMIRHGDRSLYHSLNYFERELFDEWVETNKDESPGGYEETAFYTLGTDIDLKDKEKIDLDRDREVTYSEDRGWLEKAIKYHIEWLKDHGISKDIIKPYFSGNGGYVVLDPKVGQFEDDPVKKELFCRSYNKIIKKIEEDFFKEYPEASEYVQFDAINNSKRQWKTPLSVHKTRNFVCVPLDVDGPKIDLERAAIPLEEDVLEEVREWIQLIDTEEAHDHIRKLRELLNNNILEKDVSPMEAAKEEVFEGVKGEKKSSQVEGEKKSLQVDLDLDDMDKFPPCISELIYQVERKKSDPVLAHARGKALLSVFLNKINIEKEEARKVWTDLCNAAGGPKTNIFKSYFKDDFKLPNCKKIQKPGSGFPYMEFGDLELCEPDETCKCAYVKSPRDYIKGPDSDEEDPIEKYFTDDNTPKFIPPKLAKDIMEDFHFATIEGTSHIHVYRDGIYQEKGESFIEKIAQKRLGEYSRRHHKKEVIDYIKTHSYTDVERFDRSPRKIVVENGILDLETRGLEDHTPEEIHTSKLPVMYDPKAECPDIKAFIKNIVKNEGDLKKIQELIGYTLLKENALNKAFMGLGNGANGRSTLFRLFEKFLGGKNTSSVSLTELVKNRFASSDLFGKIANFSGETSDRKIKDSYRFKELVGEDEMRGEEKYEKAFEFVNYATPWFASNELPETEDKTRSFYRRWVIIDFPYTFTSDPEELELEDHKRKNPDLPESIITEEGLSGLLNWALDGLDRVFEKHRFTNERTVSRKSELWELESNPVANFIEEWCVEDENALIPKDVLYEAYNQFCKEEEHGKFQLGQFTTKLKAKGISQTKKGPRGNRIKCYVGIRIKEDVLEELVSTVSGQIVKTLRNIMDFDCVNKESREYIEKVLSDEADTPDTKATDITSSCYDANNKEERDKELENMIKDELKDGSKEIIDVMNNIIEKSDYTESEINNEIVRLAQEKKTVYRDDDTMELKLL